MAELSLIGLVTAFTAGVISFLSPCVLPLVPGYVSYVAGTSLEELRDGAAPRLQSAGLAATFVLGFSLVFVAFGASATALGSLLLAWRYELGLIAGVVVILFGLHMLGLTPLQWMNRDARFHLETGRRPHARRAPARHRLRLRLDALHRPGARRDPDARRQHRKRRQGRDAARGLLARPRPALPARRAVHRHAARPGSRRSAAPAATCSAPPAASWSRWAS